MPQSEIRLILGDCREKLKEIESESIDLVITSPPYADSRSNTYGGVSPNAYVEWFLPASAEILRVLKPSGTFILNIKEKAVNGEWHTYVLERNEQFLKAYGDIRDRFVEEFMRDFCDGYRINWQRLVKYNSVVKRQHL